MAGLRKVNRLNAAGIGGVVALVAMLVAPGSAAAYIYWGNGGDQGIGRADLGGGAAMETFIHAESPEGLAVDGTHLFWGEFNTGAIGRAGFDGSDPDSSFITGGRNPFGVAVGNGHVYWANVNENTIGRANLDGTDVGVAVEGEHIYWVNDETSIGRANLEGGEVDESFISAPGSIAIAVDAHHIYRTDNSTGSIERANLDGTDVEPSFITGASSPQSVAVDANHIYWGNYTPGTIGRANLDGTDVEEEFITAAERPLGVAVDSLPHGSAMTVSCAPSPVTQPAPASCTATVADTGPYPALPGPLAPTGTVSFATGASCALHAEAGGRSSCAVGYAPPSAGTVTISATFAGDGVHTGSHASTTLTVDPPPPVAVSNAFALGKPKLNRKKGTASIVATVPDPGGLTLVGHGVRRLATTAPRAGEVTLALRPTTEDRRALTRTGKAKLSYTVTYAPTGGAAASRRGKVTLHLARAGTHR